MVLAIAIAIAVGIVACNKRNNADLQTQDTTTATKTKSDMKNFISIVEIPTKEFTRAVSFYQSVLEINIEETEIDGIRLGLFPGGAGVFVQLINGAGYTPSTEGTTVYLNGGDDLQEIADKILESGGKILVPKTAIGPEMGFFAIFIDTEGNKLGLHSNN